MSWMSRAADARLEREDEMLWRRRLAHGKSHHNHSLFDSLDSVAQTELAEDMDAVA